MAANRIGERRLILWSAATGALGAVVIATAWTPGVVLAGIAIVAIGMAAVVPSVNTVLGRRVRAQDRALALSRAWMIGITGFFVGPATMGLVSEQFGLRIAFAVLALIIAMIIPAIVNLGRIAVIAQDDPPNR